ncbi:MAG: precorrin-3B C(17)-methyltransferase [Lachnospiraceae bacterium]|nr:precorrin-3B C(17)-methyltransferase [Lachnospiraceae bacterium]
MLRIIGFGPGSPEGMTLEAEQALKESELIIGYTVYVELMKRIFPEKQYYDTGMRSEKERCEYAIAKTIEGVETAIVCSGDSGIYGMASLVMELPDAQNIEIKVIPGVTAAASGGAVLGAPLTHDFAVISLSDLMTPLELIEKRIACAAMSDMVIVLYNPSSKKRKDYLKKACEIVLKYQREDTVCGFVKNIGREGQCYEICTLNELKEKPTDMFTTVFIGNSTTKNIGKYMVTPRGYRV